MEDTRSIYLARFMLNEESMCNLCDPRYGPRIIIDTYFDTFDYALTRHGHWLRFRDGQWTLKVAFMTMGHIIRYRELTQNHSIITALHEICHKDGEPPSGDTSPILYCPCAIASFKTYRYLLCVPDMWFDVMCLRDGRFYVSGMTKYPVYDERNESDVYQCFVDDIPSKVLVYLHLYGNDSIIPYLPSCPCVPPTECLFQTNPLPSPQEPRPMTFIEMTIEMDKADFAPLFP